MRNLLLVFVILAVWASAAYLHFESKKNHVPRLASYKITHYDANGSRTVGFSKEAPVQIGQTCMRYTDMNEKLVIVCGSIFILQL